MGSCKLYSLHNIILGVSSAVENLNFTRGCLSILASWDPVSSDPVCGPVSYNVTISPSDGVMMMRVTNTSYNITGLRPDNSYIVTVAGRNDAGLGESREIMSSDVPGEHSNIKMCIAYILFLRHGSCSSGQKSSCSILFSV